MLSFSIILPYLIVDLKLCNRTIEATKRLYEVGKLIGIDVLDHIIFTDDSFISLKESGHL
ncbi:hypothetical protein ETI06_09675 [Macrococcoides goetzii]|nr:hypothetical protein ETI06_09675 [Macrococcus goetzii]